MISMYLDTQAKDRGRDQFAPWVRKQLDACGRTLDPRSEVGESFTRDRKRIESWLTEKLEPSSNGVALFACAGANEFLEVAQLAVPIDQNEIHLRSRPHLYPLARLIDQYPRCAAVIGDTNSARIVVFDLNRVETVAEVQSVKTSRSMVGGWSQARFQRHVDNFHKQHAKSVIEALDRIVREHGVPRFVLAGDQEVVIPLLKSELPRHLQEMMIDVLRLDSSTSNHALLDRTMEAMRAHDQQLDTVKVEYLTGEYQSGGLAVAGVKDTLTALENGQVDELMIAGTPSELRNIEDAARMVSKQIGTDKKTDIAAQIADLLVTRARQISAKLTFIENSALLAHLGGCGALLRYKMGETMPKKGNYNHDYYKVRGKEPGNQDFLPDESHKEPAWQNTATPKAPKRRKPAAKQPVSKKTD